MAVYKGGKWYWMHDFVNGVEYRMALKTRNWQEAWKLPKRKAEGDCRGEAGCGGTSSAEEF